MEMIVSFPGGVAVDAEWKGHVIRTDQPEKDGGANAAPAPFDLFLASMATCMGFYALRFCQERQIDPAGLSLRMSLTRDPESKRLTRITSKLALPAGFPDKYDAAIIRAMDHCAVKRVIMDPPQFDTSVERG